MTSVEIRKTESNSTVSQQPGFDLVTGRQWGEVKLWERWSRAELKSTQSVSDGDLFKLILKTGFLFFSPLGELFFCNLLTQF